MQVEKPVVFTTKQLYLQSNAVLLTFYLGQNYHTEEDFYQRRISVKGLC